MAKHIMGGHVAIDSPAYSEGQFEAIFGKCGECMQSEGHTDICRQNPEREANMKRLFGERVDNSRWIAAGAHQPIKYRSHQLLDSERGR